MTKRKIYLVLIFMVIVISSIVYLPTHIKKNETTPEPFIKLYLSQKNQVIELKLEDYLVGTVSAEMPASFDIEALKAQAVCARTYAVRKIITGKKYPRGSDLSDDITCCQAYRPNDETKKIAPQWQKKIAQAVRATRGEIMLYQDEPIDALYHSTCGGCTESAEEAWINNSPYLLSIRCKYCVNSPYYETRHSFSNQDIARQYGLKQDGKISLKILARTASGRVKSLSINNRKISGESFRETMGLPSTSFIAATNKDEIILTCHGYGHGVGLCQYGADGMARAGKDYRDILKTYYRDIDIYKMQY